MKKVDIKCKGSSMVALKDLKELQGDLKELSEENYSKLKAIILDLGFIAPFFVWNYKGVKRCIDGHQRLTTLRCMKEEGIKVPAKFPCVEIEAKNLKQAKKMILAVSSNYGTMTTLGLEGFMTGIGMDLEKVAESFSFDAINFDMMAEVEKVPVSFEAGNKEIDTENFGNDLQHTCPSCGFEFNG